MTHTWCGRIKQLEELIRAAKVVGGRLLDTFINPLVYTFEGHMPTIMTMSRALRSEGGGRLVKGKQAPAWWSTLGGSGIWRPAFPHARARARRVVPVSELVFGALT